MEKNIFENLDFEPVPEDVKQVPPIIDGLETPSKTPEETNSINQEEPSFAALIFEPSDIDAPISPEPVFAEPNEPDFFQNIEPDFPANVEPDFFSENLPEETPLLKNDSFKEENTTAENEDEESLPLKRITISEKKEIQPKIPENTLPEFIFEPFPQKKERQERPGEITENGVYIPIISEIDKEIEKTEKEIAEENAAIIHTLIIKLAYLETQYRRVQNSVSEEEHFSIAQSIGTFADSLQAQIEVCAQKEKTQKYSPTTFSVTIPGIGQFVEEVAINNLKYLMKEETWLFNKTFPEIFEKIEEFHLEKNLLIVNSLYSACSFRRLFLETVIQKMEKLELYKSEKKTVWICLNCNMLTTGFESPSECSFCQSGQSTFIEARGFSPYLMDKDVFTGEIKKQKEKKPDQLSSEKQHWPIQDQEKLPENN